MNSLGNGQHSLIHHSVDYVETVDVPQVSAVNATQQHNGGDNRSNGEEYVANGIPIPIHLAYSKRRKGT